MAINSASQSVVVSTNATRYPLRNNPAGTATAGSSDFITANIVSIDAIIVEAAGTTGGTLTISDHAGTSGTAISILIPATTPGVYPLGPYGIATGWVGLKIALDNTSVAQRVRVAFTPA